MEGTFKLSKNLTSLRFMKQAEAQKVASRGIKRKLHTERKSTVQEEANRQKIQKINPQLTNKPVEVHSSQVPKKQSNQQNQNITVKNDAQLVQKQNEQNEQQLSEQKLKQIQNKAELDLHSKVGVSGPITSGKMSFSGRGQVTENIGLKRIRTAGVVKPRNQQQRKTWEQMVKELDSSEQET